MSRRLLNRERFDCDSTPATDCDSSALLVAISYLGQTARPNNDVLLIFGMGLALIVWALANFWRYWRTRHWVPVTTRLLEVRERTRLIAIGYGRIPYLYPDVLYTYEFGETPLVGSRASVESLEQVGTRGNGTSVRRSEEAAGCAAHP